jgi:hypothetical protein
MAISPELEEQVAEAWRAGIPEQYRLTGKDKGLITDRSLSSAIILPPPKLSLVNLFLFSLFGPQHLTQKQLAAKAARANCGVRGRKREEPPPAPRVRPSRVRQSRAKYKPSGPLRDLDLLTP